MSPTIDTNTVTHNSWINKRKLIFTGILIALVGFFFLTGLEHIMRPYAIDRVYFQQWSSESLMQTVSIRDLHNRPIESLLNIHIQPPALDAIRAILVRFSSTDDIKTTLKQVDLSLYRIWAVLYGLLGFQMFVWTTQATNFRTGLLTTLLFLLHPALISYATLLDSTLLSSVLVLWMYYLLWQIKQNNNKSILLFSISVLALFFTRSFFQWNSILLFGVCLFLMGVSKKQLVTFLVITGVISGLYLAKQYYQFNIFSTSSLTGINLTKSVGINIKKRDYPIYLNGHIPDGLPGVLARKTKINGSPNYNNIQYLKLNAYLTDKYVKYMSTFPMEELSMEYQGNLNNYLLPSSTNTDNIIVERLAWRNIYDHIFSAPYLPFLFIIAVVLWAITIKSQKDIAINIAIILPGLYIFATSILFEKGENMRFKFFLEPVFYIFIVSQFYIAGNKFYRKFMTRSLKPLVEP
jgi:hypothetical protein